MKKTLLVALALMVCSIASAVNLGPKHLNPVADSRFSVCIAEDFTPNQDAVMSRSETLSINYTPAYEPYSALGFNNATAGSKFNLAFQMTKQVTTKFAGNDITAITFYTGINKTSKVNNVKQARVFITEDLQKDPVYSQDYTISTTQPYSFISVPLDTPYKIQADKPIYVGVEFVIVKADDLPIVIDYADHGYDDCGGWVGYYDKDKLVWDNITSYYGFVCVGCKIEGDKMPQNRIEVYDMACDPVVSQNKPFPLYVALHNTGANDASSIELTYSIGDKAPVSETFEIPTPLPYNHFITLEIPELSYDKASADEIKVALSVNKVNDVDNEETENSANVSVLVLPEGKGYQRNVVIEEMTGNWCGYCPRGIVTMDAIHDNYPDGGIIPVAIHVNTSGATDPMYASSFSQVGNFVSSVPGAVLNRQTQIYPWPYKTVIEACDEIRALPAVGKIDLEVKKTEGDNRAFVLSTTTEFVFSFSDASQRYILAFAVTEDGVGPYYQTNYYSGGGEGNAGGWEKLGSSVSTIYNDVARQLNTYSGISGSVPASVEAGVPYHFDYNLNLVSKVSNPEKINIVAYLINRATGVVENACTVKSAEIFGSVEIVATDSQAPVEYFNLQGMPVKDPSDGIYIRRQGSSVTKVMFCR